MLRFEDEDLGQVPPVRAGTTLVRRLSLPRGLSPEDPRPRLPPGPRARTVAGWTTSGGRETPFGSRATPTSTASARRGRSPRRSSWSSAGPVGVSRALRLKPEPVHRPDVTAAADQEVAALDWSGFVATLPIDQLAGHGRRNRPLGHRSRRPSGRRNPQERSFRVGAVAAAAGSRELSCRRCACACRSELQRAADRSHRSAASTRALLLPRRRRAPDRGRRGLRQGAGADSAS